MEGYIYVLTSPSGKHYVGQTWNIAMRWNCYMKLYTKQQRKLDRALRKYGPENFIFYIIDAAKTQEVLDKKEIYWIGSYDAVNNGYNIEEGGRFCKTTNPRNEELNFTVDTDEKAKIEYRAQLFGFKNVSDYIRFVSMNSFLMAGIDTVNMNGETNQSVQQKKEIEDLLAKTMKTVQNYFNKEEK
jgi:group I intron endonuclease